MNQQVLKVAITLIVTVTGCCDFVRAQASNLADQLSVQTTDSPNGKITRGHFTVYEDREKQEGRKIKLNLVVLRANGDDVQPDPVFYLAGGPGQAAAQIWRGFQTSWIRKDRDIVLISQRGTDGDNRLAFEPFGNDRSLQRFLDPFLMENVVRENLERLKNSADLRMYSTPLAMDDYNDIRQALGYDKINLIGGSYGTRAALVYMRRHGDSVRTATLNGIAPIEFRNPLYHAQTAQQTLEMIFDEVEANPRYRKAYPDLRKKFATVLERFEDDGPVSVEIENSSTGEVETVQLTRENFGGSLRFQMYYTNTSRRVPALIEQAYQGNFKPFAQSAIRRNSGFGIAAGMLMCVTAAEDVARIKPEEVEELTAGTFLGAGRVYRQMAAAKLWPKSDLPDGFGEPVVSDVPTLLLSGTIDPVTSPKWGEVAAKNLSNSLHIVAPAAHGVGGACINSIQKQFLKTGSVEGLDTSCIAEMKLPPIELPPEMREEGTDW